MIKLKFRVCIFLVPIILNMNVYGEEINEVTLAWSFTNPKNGEAVSLGTKGSIQEALIRSGYLPDPFVKDNERLFDWIEEEKEWVLTSNFELSNEQINNQYIDIELPSVDTYAEIYLNGKLILSCKNAFLPYRMTISNYVKTGKNELIARFTPPLVYHRETYQNATYKLPAPNDKNPIAIAPYTRKPQYQFGWDWALRMNTIGFNKPVKIVCYAENKIISSSVQTLAIKDSTALLSISLELAQPPSNDLVWKSELFGEVNRKKEGNWLTSELHVKNPNLWWPVNYGKAYLYHDTWTLSKQNKVDHIEKSFGIRTAELVQKKDFIGTSYELVINGKTIFCKGGNVIPQEVFLAQITDSATSRLVEQMSLANFNIARVWGGGYYPDDLFYELCDQKGIMVWQDFMFACAIYPGTDDFLENVRREIKYQIPRISAHPSVVLFNGNNEVDVAWKNWGFQIQYGLFGKNAKAIEKAYDDLFKKLIPQEMDAITSTPYVHTSPLSNWGKDEFYNHGTQHYWGVWHGKDPITNLSTKIGRFNAEYGFQSFPEYSTLSKVIPPTNWDLKDALMKHRQKSYVGNEMIQKQADILFGKTDDFKTFIYYSQLTQAKSVSMAISAHRTDWPRCSGTIYWQVNDCWPAPTWSGIDYYGNWKALHYEVKKDFMNVAVLAVERRLNHKEFYLVADACDTFSTTVRFQFYQLDGTFIVEHQLKKQVYPQSVQQLPIFDLFDNPLENYIVKITWENEKHEEQERVFYNLMNHQNIAQNPEIDVMLNEKSGKQYITLKTDKPLLSCWIYSEHNPFHLSTNFETLLPGTHTFQVESREKIKLSEIKWRFLQ